MEKSNSIAELTKALIKYKKAMPKITLDASVKVKTKTGGEYSFDYASLPNIKEKSDPVLSDNGLFVSQLIEEGGKMTTILMHESGEFIQSTMSVGKTEGITAQEYGSLITYARRYAYCAILGIIADDDDDANRATGNSTEKKQDSSDNKPWLNPGTPQWKDAVEYLVNGGGSIAKIETKYKLSKTNKDKLIEEAQGVLS